MEFLQHFATALWELSLDAAPSLLFGLALAGILITYLPSSKLGAWLEGDGFWPILRAAAIGTPLPLCSCSVVPVATGLRRSGTSNGATLSFLIATPENGPDSLTLSYVLLGPVLAIARPVAAILSAVTAGLLVSPRSPQAAPAASECGHCGCCGDTEKPAPARPTLLGGLRYAATDMLDEILPWLLGGMVVAALLHAALPPNALTHWGSGLGAKFAMLLMGIPVYVCATASTPVAASLLAAGISPGTTLVFLLAGPATNLGALGIVRAEMGMQALRSYLIGACLVPIVCGVALDALVIRLAIPPFVPHAHHELTSPWSIASLALLTLLALRPLRKRILGGLLQPVPAHSA